MEDYHSLRTGPQASGQRKTRPPRSMAWGDNRRAVCSVRHAHWREWSGDITVGKDVLESLTIYMAISLRPPGSSSSARLATVVALCALSVTAAGAAWADAPWAVPPPQDTPYSGTIQIAVDATDTAQGIFRVHETIPVRGRELTLLYPQWIPGNHSP